MAANPMANRSAALAGAAQALNKPKMPGGDFRQNLAGATGNTIQGAHGGTQQLGMAAQKRLEAAGTAMKPAPSIPMPPVKQPMPMPGGDPTSMAKPLPGFNPGQMTPPIFAGGQQPGQPPVDQKPDIMGVLGSDRKPVFNSGAQQGVQGPGGSDQDQMQSGGGLMSGEQQMMDRLHGQMGGASPGTIGQINGLPGQISVGPGGIPSNGFIGGPGDKPFGGALPGFGGAPGVHGVPGGPDGGIMHMPGGPGQISIHGSPGGLPTKPMADPGNPDVWSRIAGGPGAGGVFRAKRDPMAGMGPGPNGTQLDF